MQLCCIAKLRQLHFIILLAELLKSKNKDNIYAYTLDGVMAIMEKGDGKERFTIPLKERRKEIKNTVNDILDNIKRCEG